MLPLLVLIIVFSFVLLLIRVLKETYRPAFSARVAMSCMLLFTASGHFAFSEGMTMMLPDFIPYKAPLVWFTGGLEILAAIGLHIPKLRKITGLMLVLFFLLVLPANIYAAIHHIDYQNATLEGDGPEYLWFRVPLQLFFILWVYLSAIKG